MSVELPANEWTAMEDRRLGGLLVRGIAYREHEGVMQYQIMTPKKCEALGLPTIETSTGVLLVRDTKGDKLHKLFDLASEKPVEMIEHTVVLSNGDRVICRVLAPTGNPVWRAAPAEPEPTVDPEIERMTEESVKPRARERNASRRNREV